MSIRALTASGALFKAAMHERLTRAPGITSHVENGGRLEDVQELAGHADARTRQLYVRESACWRAKEERVQL